MMASRAGIPIRASSAASCGAVAGVGAGGDSDAHPPGLGDDRAQAREHGAAADGKLRVVVVAAGLRQVHHGSNGRHETGSLGFQQGECLFAEAGAVLDGSDPGALGGHDLDHVHPAIDEGAHQAANGGGAGDAGYQIAQLGQVQKKLLGWPRANVVAGGDHTRQVDCSAPVEHADSDAGEVIDPQNPNRGGSRSQGATGSAQVCHVRGASTNPGNSQRPLRSMDREPAGSSTGPVTTFSMR